jgi:Uncharacterised nucleotidyltransferase
MARRSQTKPVNPEASASAEPLSPEWRILLASCGANQKANDAAGIRALLGSAGRQESTNWKILPDLAHSQGIAPLLYQNLLPVADLVPAAVLASLRGQYENNVHKSLFLARELARVLDCCDSIGVDALPYKGIVLAETYYGDVALRQAGDIDFFVRKEDFGRVKNALRDLGYVARQPVPQHHEEEYLASGYECSFDGAAGNSLLEVQWALQPRFYAVDFAMESLFSRAVRATVAGRQVNTPRPEDLLLMLSVHAAKHIWSRLIWICDIARIVRRENLDWDWVQSRARDLGILRIMHISLLLASRLFQTTIPAPLESAALSDRAASLLSSEIEGIMRAGVPYDTQKVAYFRMMLRLRERPVDRLRFLWRLAVTPGPGEWQTVRLPRPLFPLYKVVRIARLAARFARE